MQPLVILQLEDSEAKEAKEHINVLEMLTVLFALKSFSTLTHGKHVKVMVDNTVTESTINQMGTSHSPKLKKLMKDTVPP